MAASTSSATGLLHMPPELGVWISHRVLTNLKFNLHIPSSYRRGSRLRASNFALLTSNFVLLAFSPWSLARFDIINNSSIQVFIQ
jgi:hypothetical protein